MRRASRASRSSSRDAASSTESLVRASAHTIGFRCRDERFVFKLLILSVQCHTQYIRLCPLAERALRRIAAASQIALNDTSLTTTCTTCSEPYHGSRALSLSTAPQHSQKALAAAPIPESPLKSHETSTQGTQTHTHAFTTSIVAAQCLLLFIIIRTRSYSRSCSARCQTPAGHRAAIDSP